MRKTPSASAGLLVGAVAGVAAAVLAHTELLREAEFQAYDQLSVIFAEPDLAASSRVKIVLMDPADLRALGPSAAGPLPPPRGLWGEIVEFLARRRPKAIVLDLLLRGPSPPGAADDLVLAARLAAAGTVILPARVGQPSEPFDGNTRIPRGSEVPVYGRSDLLPRAGSLVLPELPLVDSARRIGVASIRPDGAVVRRIPVAFAVGEGFVPSLPVAAAMTAFDESSLNVVHAGRTLQGFAGIDLPLDGRGNLLLNFRGPRGSFRTISIAELREAMLDPDHSKRWLQQIKQRDILVLGLNLPGSKDEHATPTDPAMPGPEVIATAIDNIVRGDARRQGGPSLLRLLPVLFGCATGLLFACLRPLTATLSCAGLLASYFAGAIWLFRLGFVLEFLTPPMANLLAGLTLTFLTRQSERGTPTEAAEVG